MRTEVQQEPQLPDHLLELARQHGIDVSDVKGFNGELSDADLEAIVGGKPPKKGGPKPKHHHH